MAQTPHISIHYAESFDNICEWEAQYKISKKWVREVEEKLPAWQNAWRKDGETLLRTTVDLTKIPFQQKTFEVALSLCSFPSTSVPLLVNARAALNNFQSTPVPMHVFVSIIFHEVLHRYLATILKEGTPTTNKYRNESLPTLKHLHLYALMKAVYSKLGMLAQLKDIIDADKNLPRPDYGRAWEIVNGDSYNELLREILKRSSSK